MYYCNMFKLFIKKQTKIHEEYYIHTHCQIRYWFARWTIKPNESSQLLNSNEECCFVGSDRGLFILYLLYLLLYFCGFHGRVSRGILSSIYKQPVVIRPLYRIVLMSLIAFLIFNPTSFKIYWQLKRLHSRKQINVIGT